MANRRFHVKHGLTVNGAIGVNTESPSVSLHLAANDGIIIPVGNTGQRPSNAAGILRYNSETGALEYYGSGWVSIDAANYVSKATRVNVGGIATGGGNLAANVTVTVPEANVSQFLSGNADLVIAPDTAWSAISPVTISYSASMTPNFAQGLNFKITMGGNGTLNTPTNMRAGQCGVIEILQDGTGNRTLSYGSGWLFEGDEAPTLTTSANARDMLCFYAINSSAVWASLVNDVR